MIANTEAEMCVLGSMLLDWEASSDVFPLLSVADFYLPAHQIIFEEITLLNKSNTPTDLVILREALVSEGMLEKVGGMEYLAMIVESVPTSANAMYYANIVRDYSIRRKLVAIARELMVEAVGSGEGGNAVAVKYQAELMKLEAFDKEGLVEISKDMLDAGERLWEIEARRKAGIPLCDVTTGLKRLDNYIALDPSVLCILAGHPGMGKTAFMLNMLLANARRGVTGAVFSLEMSRKRIGLNALVSYTGISGRDAKRGRLSEFDKAKVIEKGAAISQLPGFWHTPAEMTIPDLWRWSRKAVHQHGAKFIMLDYIQIVIGDGRDTRERVGRISKALKAVAKDLDVPVIALSQMRRFDPARRDKRPKMSDLKETGNLEQDADIVLGLYREAYFEYKKAVAEGLDHLMEVGILKNREGLTGTLDDPPVYYDFDHYIIADTVKDAQGMA